MIDESPINEIEDKATWTDFGRQAYLIYKGAREESESETEAMKMVVAFYAGLFSAKIPTYDEPDDEG